VNVKIHLFSFEGPTTQIGEINVQVILCGHLSLQVQGPQEVRGPSQMLLHQKSYKPPDQNVANIILS